MIAIPIFLFVIFIIFGIVLLAEIIISIVSYITYCHYQDKKVEKKIGENYGTQHQNEQD